jgi:hypothetical protein
MSLLRMLKDANLNISIAIMANLYDPIASGGEFFVHGRHNSDMMAHVV